MTTLQEAINRFRTAAAADGVVIPANLMTDGKRHKCDTDQANGKGDARYIFHPDHPCSGGWQNWQRGNGWVNWTAKNQQPLSADEQATLARRIAQEQAEREKSGKERHRAAAQKAAADWEKAPSAPANHPYLQRKGVQPHGLLLLLIRP